MSDLRELQESVNFRMREIAAVIETMTGRVDRSSAKTREALRAMINQMQAQQDAFRETLNSLRRSETVAWDDVNREAEKTWTEFEELVSETTRVFDSERKALLSQMEAQLKGWSKIVEDYAKQASSVNEERRAAYERLVSQLRERQSELQRRMQEARAASGEKWCSLAADLENAVSELAKTLETASRELDTMKRD